MLLGVCELVVPALSLVYSSLLLSTLLEQHDRALSTEQQAQCYDLVQDNGTPLYVLLLFSVINHNGDSACTGGQSPSGNIHDLLLEYLVQLEETFGVQTSRHILSYVTYSRYGISDVEMNDLLSCNHSVMHELYSFLEPRIRRLAPMIWILMKQRLQWLLIERVSNGVRLWTWRHDVVRQVVSQRYSRSTEADAHLAMLSYFEDNVTANHCTLNNGVRSASVSHVAHSQPLESGLSVNRRRLDEVPYHMYRLKQSVQLVHTLLHYMWLTCKLRAAGLRQVLADVRLALELDSSDQQMRYLLGVLLALDNVLHMDGRQLAPHMCSRLTIADIPADYGFISALYTQAADQIGLQLRPSMQAIEPLFQNQTHNGNDNKASMATAARAAAAASNGTINALYRIHGDCQHLVSLSSDAGLLQVWNVLSRQAIRTLRGLNQPRDMRMCDATTAIVLCNRELYIYDLDKGCLLLKLKGVLNLKMPYFGVHDSQHTMALSRNRMYVNMINNHSGDIVTTFKVGEDRFLNSLLVSDNGELCVCGDVVQKPFPLLVWDLRNRKLIHDLRMQGHEFVTRIAAITNDGHYVVCVCKVRVRR